MHTNERVEDHSYLGSALEDGDTLAGRMMEHVKPLLVGSDPFETDGLWAAMWRHKRSVSVRPIGAVDVALWDLKGKAVGQPVNRLIGTCRESVPT